MVKRCKTCKKEVRISPYRAKEFKFCSYPCKYKAWTGQGNKFWKGGEVGLTCKQCKKKYLVRRYRRKKSLFCSASCRSKFNYKIIDIGFKKGRTPWNKGINNPFWTGKNNPNWKGGTTTKADKIRKTINYKNWRRAVFLRDDYTCQWCKGRGGYLHAHHIKSQHKYPELRHEVSNGQTLCVECHRKTSNYGEKALYSLKSTIKVVRRGGAIRSFLLVS